VSGGLIGSPLAALAQQPGKVPRIGFISTTLPGSSPATDAFLQGLRELAYVEGRSIAIEWRWGRGSTRQFPEFAADMVRLKVNIIVAANDTAGHAAQLATRTFPIVIPDMADPVGSGFVANLARPGGNITGLTLQSFDIVAKRLQLFREAFPKAPRIGLLVDSTTLDSRQEAAEAETAARVLGMQLQRLEVSTSTGLEDAFAALATEGANAVFTVGGTLFYANRVQLAEQALKRQLTMMCGGRDAVQAGCLMGYSANLEDLFRRAAIYVDKILKGASPADLPVEQPTKFELAINLKTAKALGITMPPWLLSRADEVIE
jgi:putative ABC transport system substrate-binding protein